jgi:hypothetical protein
MEIRLAVTQVADEDSTDTALWEASLREELTELDQVTLRYLTEGDPSGAKGISAFATLIASVPASWTGAFMQFLQGWSRRTGRTVEASIAGDTIKITAASREQQDKVIEAWIVHHAPGP